MKLKVKKLEDKAVLPMRAHDYDAGMDLTAVKITTELSEDNRLVLVYHTGIAVEIPKGYVGLLFPRSSIFKKSLALTNCVGVIDAGYRGEIIAKFNTNTNVVPAIYREGERIVQLVIVEIPSVEIEEVAELTPSEDGRNEGGYGSSDRVEDTTSTPNNKPSEDESIESVVAEEVIA